MRPSRRLDALRVALLAAAAGLNGFVALAIARHWPTDEILRRDYRVFWEAGRRLLGGDLAGIYDARPGGFPFLHPPPVIALSAPLGALSPRAVYAVVLALSVLALAASALALRALGPRKGEQDVLWLLVLASAPWAIALIVGQPAALFLAAWTLGLLALERGRPLSAGVLLGALWLKPQLALAALLLGLRRPRLALGMLAAALALALLSLPAGLARWPEWAEAAARAGAEVGAARIVLWKQHTLLAFLRSVTPGAAIAWSAWALVALPLGALVVRAVRAGSTLRAGSLLVLATLALSPYAYYYDALLLAVPAARLWLERERDPRTWALAALACATFACQHVTFFALQRGPALCGLLVTAWLAAELAPGRSADGASASIEAPAPPAERALAQK